MTREEAINHIKYGVIKNNYPLPKELGIEVFNMAIKALEQEPTAVEIVTCKDCKHNRPNSYARTQYSCDLGHRFKLRDCENFYCADGERG
jgi:hypothetical protein